jgi:hypothetical protein
MAREVLNQAARFAIIDESLQTQAHDAAQEIGISKGLAAVSDIQTQLLELKNIWSEVLFSLRNNSQWVLVLASLIALGVGWGTLY